LTQHPPHRNRQALATVGIVACLGLIATLPAQTAQASPSPVPSSSLAVSSVVLNVGANQTRRNLVWYANVTDANCVQFVPIRKGSASFRHATLNCKTTQGTSSADATQTYFHATMSGLSASTRYAYRVGSDSAGWSGVYNFSTGGKTTFNFAYYGDPQVYPATSTNNPGAGWANTVKVSTEALSPEFLLTAGDQVNSYTNAGQSAEWPLFLAPEQLTTYPLATTVGNHDNANGDGVQYSEHLALPNVSSTGETAKGTGDYWFTYNNTLFMVLNTNYLDSNADGVYDLDAINQHASFLKGAISRNPHATWRIVDFHHALYSAADHPNDTDVTFLRTNLSPILSKLGVDVVLNGHDHDYARSYLMSGTSVIPGTNTSTVKAKKGQVLYIEANSASGGKFYPLTGPYPWTAVVNQENVANYTNVKVSQNSIAITTYRATDSSVVDTVTLKHAREHHTHH